MDAPQPLPLSELDDLINGVTESPKNLFIDGVVLPLNAQADELTPEQLAAAKRLKRRFARYRPPITPSAPHAFTEGQSITMEGIRGLHAHLNGTYVVNSASSFVQIHDKSGSRLDCKVVTKFSVGDEAYLVLDPVHPAVCLIHIKGDGSDPTQFVEQSDKDFDKILSVFEEVLNDCAFSLGLSERIAIEPFGGHLIAIGLGEILEEGADGADLDNLETPEEGKELWDFLVSIHFYHGDSRGHQEYALYFREPDFYYVAKASDLVLVEDDEMDMVRQVAEAAIDAVLPPAEGAPPITP